MWENKKSKLLTSLKIAIFIVYVALTIWICWGLLDIIINPTENFSASVAIYLAIVVIIFGMIGYSVCLILALIGLIVVIKKRAGKGNLIFFIVSIILSIITEMTFILVCKSIT